MNFSKSDVGMSFLKKYAEKAFMNNFDCYAQGNESEVIPAMTKDKFMNLIFSMFGFSVETIFTDELENFISKKGGI